MPLILHPGSVPLATLEAVYRTGRAARLDPACDGPIAAAAARIADVAAGSAPVYGVNTGFGKLAAVRIGPGDVATLQRNLILSHCCGVGEPLAADVVRLVMTLKLMSLGRGASGVRPVGRPRDRGHARPRRGARSSPARGRSGRRATWPRWPTWRRS